MICLLKMCVMWCGSVGRLGGACRVRRLCDVPKHGILRPYLSATLGVAYSSRSSTMFSTLSTYDMNHTAIAFLSNIIENANGSDVSAVRDACLTNRLSWWRLCMRTSGRRRKNIPI